MELQFTCRVPESIVSGGTVVHERSSERWVVLTALVNRTYFMVFVEPSCPLRFWWRLSQEASTLIHYRRHVQEA